VLCEAGIVFGIDDCEFAPGERDFSKWAAVTETAVEENQVYARLHQPLRNVEGYFDVATLHWVKSEARNPKQIQITEIRNFKRFVLNPLDFIMVNLLCASIFETMIFRRGEKDVPL